MLCFHSHVAERRHLPITLNKDVAFLSVGFSNWKKAIERFNKHEKSTSHRQAVELVEKMPKTTRDVGDMLSSIHAQQKAKNREMLKIILSSIRFLEVNSNFIQLLKLRAEDNPKLLKWMEKSRDKFTSPDIQNEILSIMSLYFQREINSEISGKWFTIMVDETTDLSNTEQMVFCLRYVDDNLEVHEEFIGLYSLDSTSAESIV